MTLEIILFKIFEFGVVPLSFILVLFYSFKKYGKKESFNNFSRMALTGFFAEQLTILIFKKQTYGSDYLIMIFDVPLVIILGWVFVIFISRELISRLKIKNKVVPYLLMGALALNIDLIMDPMAMRIGLWVWNGTHYFYGVPFGNFVGWFLIVSIYHAMSDSERLKNWFKNDILRSGAIIFTPAITIILVGIFWLDFGIEEVITFSMAKSIIVISSLLVFLIGIYYNKRIHYSKKVPYKMYNLPGFIFIFWHLVLLGFSIVLDHKPFIILSLFLILAATPYLFKITYFSKRMSRNRKYGQ